MTVYQKAGSVLNADSYRANTDRITRKMPGVTSIPARAKCCCCEKMRTAETGKYSKSGKFTCGMCHSPRRVS